MQLRRFSLAELLWWITAASLLLGLVRSISANPVFVLGVIWILVVVVLRTPLGWGAALMCSAACGVLLGGVFGYLMEEADLGLRIGEAAFVFTFVGMLYGLMLAEAGIVLGVLLQQMARATGRVRFHRANRAGARDQPRSNRPLVDSGMGAW